MAHHYRGPRRAVIFCERRGARYVLHLECGHIAYRTSYPARTRRSLCECCRLGIPPHPNHVDVPTPPESPSAPRSRRWRKKGS